jgi:hypothetical protein
VIERTRDHKLVEELVDSGQLTPQQARASALAHVVTRALGGRSPREATVKPGSPGHVWKLFGGDRVVVVSDGVCDLVDDDEIARITSEGTIEAVRDRLVELSLERGGHDNITCIVAEWGGPDWIEEEVATPVMRPGRELDDLLQDERTLHPDSLPHDEPSTTDPGGEVTARLPLLDSQRDASVRRGDVDDGRVTEEIAHDAASDQGPAPRTEPVERLPVAPLQRTPPPATREPGRSAPDPQADAATEPSAGPRTATPPGTRSRPYTPPAPPPDPGGTMRFDWRFLVVVGLGLGLVVAILGYFTR